MRFHNFDLNLLIILKGSISVPWVRSGMMAQTVSGLQAVGFSAEELYSIERGNSLRRFPRLTR